MDLFVSEKNTQEEKGSEPLASRMRPHSLEEFFGQKHILKPNSLLRRVIQADKLQSLIFYGPPGTGKTTLALIISHETKSRFESINAVSSNVGDMRKALDRARSQFKTTGKKTILFVDEIHRFSKSQQDVLMPDVEKGNPILIGATTYNPFFSIVPALISRSMIFELKSLEEAEIVDILKRAIGDTVKGLGEAKAVADDEALSFLAKACDGDARKSLNALEIGILSTQPNEQGQVHFNIEAAQESIQKKAVRYDKDGDGHYDHASALIKSMRGSDPNAAVYYLAKMLYAGEDPRFLARRIVICAAEDVGNADPQALILANAALQASEFIGMPEARIPLAQAVTYIACSPKSNAAYMAINKATDDVKEGRSLEIPAHLKDASYKSAAKLGRGEGYKYAHDYAGHHVEQEYLPTNKVYYEPTSQGQEAKFQAYLKSIRAH
ncbi:MAG: putative ATPase [Candidatus Omnitrophota bacterium]|jgi:putative ATPase